MPGRDLRIINACFRPNAHGLGGRVVRGAVWLTSLTILRTILTIGSTAVLARLLTPTDYGLVALAAIVTEMAALLGSFGLMPIVVQKPRLTRLDLDTAFWMSVALGVGLAAFVIGVSFVADDLFRAPELTSILWAMSLLFLFENFSAVHEAIVNRLLLFKYEFTCQIANFVIRILVSIALALAGHGVWSLVWGTIAGRATQFVLIWYFIPYVPRLRFNAKFLRRSWRDGGSYIGGSVLAYLALTFDVAVVGRLFGPTQLGYYQTAFALPEILRSRLSFSMQKLLFPAYALLQSDHSTFRDGVLKSIRILSAVVVPMGIGMAVLADPIVRTLYGSQWTAVVPILQIVAIVGILRALQALLGNVYFAKGRPELFFRFSLAVTPVLLLAVLIGSHWGTTGVATGVLVFSAVSLASTYRALRLIELGPLKALGALLPATLAGAFMGGGLMLLNAEQVLPHLTVILELMVNVVIGMGLFGIALFFLSRETVADLWSIQRSLRRQQ